MKVALLILCFVATTFALSIGQEQAYDDMRTRNDLYYLCKTDKVNSIIGGTACLVWNFASPATPTAIQGTFYIAHSEEYISAKGTTSPTSSPSGDAPGNWYNEQGVIRTYLRQTGSETSGVLARASKKNYGVSDALEVTLFNNVSTPNFIHGGFPGAAVTGGLVIPFGSSLIITLDIGVRFVNLLEFHFSEAEIRVASKLSLRNRDLTALKYIPTYIETITPASNNLLLRRNPLNGNNRNAGFITTIVAVGTGVSGQAQYKSLKEGAQILVNPGACFSQLVHINSVIYAADDVLAFSPYCWVAASDVLMVISEAPEMANRASRFTSQIRKSQSSSFVWAPRSTFEPLHSFPYA